jgi:NarL family two-component system response regulator LiaR
MTVRVVIADDHHVVRDGLCYLLGQEPGVEVAGEAADGRQAVDVVAATRPDVLLLDLYMPGLDGHAVLAALHDASAPYTPARPPTCSRRHRPGTSSPRSVTPPPAPPASAPSC